MLREPTSFARLLGAARGWHPSGHRTRAGRTVKVHGVNCAGPGRAWPAESVASGPLKKLDETNNVARLAKYVRTSVDVRGGVDREFCPPIHGCSTGLKLDRPQTFGRSKAFEGFSVIQLGVVRPLTRFRVRILTDRP
jgi:hypothetical protein